MEITEIIYPAPHPHIDVHAQLWTAHGAEVLEVDKERAVITIRRTTNIELLQALKYAEENAGITTITSDPSILPLNHWASQPQTSSPSRSEDGLQSTQQHEETDASIDISQLPIHSPIYLHRQRLRAQGTQLH